MAMVSSNMSPRTVLIFIYMIITLYGRRLRSTTLEQDNKHVYGVAATD